MLYLKNSLVNLIIILFSLFFLTILSAEESNFIFPKKKIISTKISKNKQGKIVISKSLKLNNLPKKKPFIKALSEQKKLKTNNKTIVITQERDSKNKITFTGLPQEKPISKNNTITKKLNKPYLEDKTQKIIKQIKEKAEGKVAKKVLKTNDIFLYPSKKPLVYSNVSSKTEVRSKILKEKDYLLAKSIFNLIKKRKWNSALDQTKKIKDKEFKNLVNWLYLKQTGNQATFNDYQNFISRNPDYPRISRLRYMAEHKIVLENTSPKSIINWFDNSEPLSGTGKIKLGEAYFKIKEIEIGSKLIKSGWVTADLSKRDVR